MPFGNQGISRKCRILTRSFQPTGRPSRFPNGSCGFRISTQQGLTVTDSNRVPGAAFIYAPPLIC